MIIEVFVMNIEKLFDFLVKDYNLSYKYQEFTNCFGMGLLVRTHSFYNESGCLSIYEEVQFCSMSFYYASKFSTKLDDLLERGIDVTLIEPEIWNKRGKIFNIRNPFFWWGYKRILKTFAEVLQAHLTKNNEFFGIQV